jgi:hypothetical protein
VKGKPYGYSCAKKFMDKPTKVIKGDFVKADSFEIIDKAHGYKVRAMVNGKKYCDSFYVNNGGEYIWTKTASYKSGGKTKDFTFMSGNEDAIYVNIEAYESYKKDKRFFR